MSEPLKNLAQAVCNVMGEVESLPKDGTNSFQNYSYTTESMVANTLRPLMVKNGLALVPHNISVVDSGVVGKHNRVVLSASYLLVHTSGESLTVTIPGEGMDSLDKSTTKALTAALKYALLQTFCVGRGEDGDGGHGYEAPKVSENAAVRQAAAAAATPGVTGEYVFTFGKNEGLRISQVDSDYLKWLLDSTEAQIKDPDKARFKDKNKAMLETLLTEINRRARNANDPNDLF